MPRIQLIHEIDQLICLPGIPAKMIIIKDPEVLAEDLVGFRALDGLEDADWFQHIAADSPRLAGVQDILSAGEPVCGRLHPDKTALLYGTRAEDVQSSALLSLPGVGLVALGSRDPNRFFPGMGTLFLRMMGEALAAGLQRFA